MPQCPFSLGDGTDLLTPSHLVSSFLSPLGLNYLDGLSIQVIVPVVVFSVMADDSQSVVSSRENLLDEDAALADLPSALLPDYAATVQETAPTSLGALMSHWLNLHLTEVLKGKPLTEALGQIAVMAVTQLKTLDKEVK
ncbi:hypothetical protein MHYP_G00093810 [Metynnis hypsauchen]